jgi:uncharacterized HAD superfamily protein
MKRARLGFKRPTKIYGIDLDGVCFDFVNPFRLWLNDHLHCHLEEEEITSYYWYEDTDISKEEFFREFDSFGHAGGYRNLPLLSGTKEALNAIVANGHEIMYVTNRPEYALRDTIAALKEHNFPFRKQLIFAKGKKSPIIKEKNIDVFIDDSPRTITEITALTRATIYCRSYPFNEYLDDTFFTRVNSWDEFLEHERIKIPQV